MNDFQRAARVSARSPADPQSPVVRRKVRIDLADGSAGAAADRIVRQAIDMLAPDADPGAHRPARGRGLTVGPADDPLEREAERTADHVVSALSRADRSDRSDRAGTVTTSPPTRIARAAAAAAPEVGRAGGQVTHGLSDRIARASGGVPLDDGVRARMEGAFGADFGAVRVHAASPLPERVAADAFTLGGRIHFAPGRYEPSSPSGERLLAHELTHVVQQGGHATVRRARTALTTKQVVSIVDKIPQLRNKLSSTDRTETVRSRIEASLRAYKAHMAKKQDEDVDLRDAMMLSTALGQIARAFAEELNDPSVAATLMPSLFDAFETEIGAKLRRKKRAMKTPARKNVLALTKALSGGDPVTQYMHREIRKEVAAQQIITMASADPGLTPVKVFELMTERWEAAMSTYTPDQQLKTVKDPAGSFNRAEAHGEYSKYFFEKTFGSDTPTWQAGGAGGAEQLTLTADAAKNLADLRAEVLAPTQQTAVQPRAGITTANQERHLAGLEQAEAALGSVDNDFLTVFADRYLLTSAAAQKLLADVKTFLSQDMKLTITVELGKWFGSDAAPKTPNRKFAPATARKDTTALAKLFGKPGVAGTVDHLPTWDDTGLGASARGPSYLRFRHWKDQLMTGLQNMSGAEMASFGAANINWETVKGGDDRAKPGTNYYGDLHFVLDRSKFANRIVFTATDHGEPRRNPLYALHDFCSKGKGRTWLRDVKDFAVLDNVVNAVRAKTPIYGLGLVLEFQVFGGIDMIDDVAEVHLAPGHSATALQRVQAFYTGKNVAVSTLGSAAPPNSLMGGGGDRGEGIPRFISLLLAHGAALDANEKQAVEAARGDTKLMAYERDLLAGSYGMAMAVTKTARALSGRLEPGDDVILQKQLAQAKGMLTSINQSKADATLLAQVKAQITAAEAAVAKALRAPKVPPKATKPAVRPRPGGQRPPVPPKPAKVGTTASV